MKIYAFDVLLSLFCATRRLKCTEIDQASGTDNCNEVSTVHTNINLNNELRLMY